MTKLSSLVRKILASTSFRTNLPLLIALFACVCAPHCAHAQGLVGAPVSGFGGCCNQVSALADYGYDTARGSVNFSTLFSAVAMSLLTTWRVAIVRGRLKKILTVTPTFDATRRLGRTCLRWISATVALPTAIHLIGTFAINNFGGLSGSL